MRTITIRPVLEDGVPVEAERMTPDILAGLSPEEIGDLEAWHGNRRHRMVELFEISASSDLASPEETNLILDGDFSSVKRIGEKMTAGGVVIRGNVGMHTGNNMRGGEIRILGDAGDWLGREMRGGKILVKGNAGNYVGSGYRGEKCGMRGGEILVEGNAEAFLGEHLCGGTIRVAGDVGDFPGAMNQGGEIFIGGSTHLPGAEMTKGKIVVKGLARVLPSYQLLENVEMEGKSYRKLTGDLVENGKGELYIAL